MSNKEPWMQSVPIPGGSMEAWVAESREDYEARMKGRYMQTETLSSIADTFRQENDKSAALQQVFGLLLGLGASMPPRDLLDLEIALMKLGTHVAQRHPQKP